VGNPKRYDLLRFKGEDTHLKKKERYIFVFRRPRKKGRRRSHIAAGKKKRRSLRALKKDGMELGGSCQKRGCFLKKGNEESAKGGGAQGDTSGR